MTASCLAIRACRSGCAFGNQDIAHGGRERLLSGLLSTCTLDTGKPRLQDAPPHEESCTRQADEPG